MTDKELLQQALDALNRSDYLGWQVNIPIIKALRSQLAQQEQEPVTASEALRYAAKVVQLYDDACMNDDYMIDANDCENILNALAEYYEAGHTAPPQREWVGLTDEEIRNEANHHVFDESFFNGAIWARGQIMGKNNG